MLRYALAAVALLTVLVHAQTSAGDLAQRAKTKLHRFTNNEYKPREVVEFPAAEINAWVAAVTPETVPEGLRNPHIDLGQGTITATALVDFLKLRQSKGQVTNRLIARMIEGERPLKVSVRLASAGGRCTVFLTRVELSGVVLEGTVLDFLIQNFFSPLYPDAKINTPFDLDYNIDRLEATPQTFRVILK